MCIMATVGLKCLMNDTGVYSEVKLVSCGTDWMSWEVVHCQHKHTSRLQAAPCLVSKQSR